MKPCPDRSATWRRRTVRIAVLPLAVVLAVVVLFIGLRSVTTVGAAGPVTSAGDVVDRMWLELDPARFDTQPMVTRILWLRQLAESLPVEEGDAGSRSRRAALFSQASRTWQRHVRVRAPRPAAFEPAALQEVVDLGGPGRLFWTAADPQEPQGIVAMIGDLEQIWGEGMQAAVADYEAAFAMLGAFRHAAAEVRQEKGRLTGRLLLVAASEGDAKRASGALALASTLGRMVSATAVKSGGMTSAEGAALDAVLGSIDTRVDGARLTVHLGIDVATLRAMLD